MIHDFSETFSSLVPVDQKDRAARGAEEFLSLQSLQVWKILLGVMIHQHQTETLTGPFIRLKIRTQCWDGLSRTGCQHLELQRITKAQEEEFVCNVVFYLNVIIQRADLSWLYLGVFEASYKYDFLPYICCEWIQLHCEQSASRGQQTQQADRSVTTVHPQLQHPGGTDTPHHFIQGLS